LARQAAVATLVVRLHGCGLLHGDLKASNVLVTAEGPRFIDLDAVRVVGDDARACRAQAKERARFLANWHGDAYASWARALAAARHAGATP
jgi:serine/threonine-protein kinase RIO1